MTILCEFWYFEPVAVPSFMSIHDTFMIDSNHKGYIYSWQIIILFFCHLVVVKGQKILKIYKKCDKIRNYWPFDLYKSDPNWNIDLKCSRCILYFKNKTKHVSHDYISRPWPVDLEPPFLTPLQKNKPQLIFLHTLRKCEVWTFLNQKNHQKNYVLPFPTYPPIWTYIPQPIMTISLMLKWTSWFFF